jgi:hypothetical protein
MSDRAASQLWWRHWVWAGPFDFTCSRIPKSYSVCARKHRPHFCVLQRQNQIDYDVLNVKHVDNLLTFFVLNDIGMLAEQEQAMVAVVLPAKTKQYFR